MESSMASAPMRSESLPLRESLWSERLKRESFLSISMKGFPCTGPFLASEDIVMPSSARRSKMNSSRAASFFM